MLSSIPAHVPDVSDFVYLYLSDCNLSAHLLSSVEDRCRLFQGCSKNNTSESLVSSNDEHQTNAWTKYINLSSEQVLNCI